MCFPRKFRDIPPFQCHHQLIPNVGLYEQECYHVLILSNKLRYWQISGQHSKVLPINSYSGGAQVEFPFVVSQFCINLGLTCLFLVKLVPIFYVGKIIYWVGNFGQWAGWINGWANQFTGWANAHLVNLLFTSLTPNPITLKPNPKL